MMTNKKIKKLILALSISILLYGWFLFFRLHYYMYLTFEAIIIYSCLTIFSSFCIYYFYLRGRRTGLEESSREEINVLNVLLGFMLIFIDITFNLIVGDEFGNFDISLILCGIGIVALNTDLLKFLKLDENFINFASRFLFVFVLLYGFLFSGIKYLTGNLTENYLLTSMTILSGRVSCFFLNFVGPTAIHSIYDPWSEGISINFKGFEVGIFSPCSGVESIVVFLSAVAGYIFSEKNINIKKMVIYTIIGLIALFLINVLRIISLVLIGYSFGGEPMKFFHYNLGWIFFVCGMAVFWLLVMREEEG